jgi:hypothetical protein
MSDARILTSLGATLAGWGAGFFSYALYGMLSRRAATDLGAMLFWPGLFILMGWLVIFLPILRLVPSGHRLFSPLVFPLVGAALGLSAFFSLVAWWTGFGRFPIFPLYAAVAGGVAAAVYAFANRALLRGAASAISGEARP